MSLNNNPNNQTLVGGPTSKDHDIFSYITEGNEPAINRTEHPGRTLAIGDDVQYSIAQMVSRPHVAASFALSSSDSQGSQNIDVNVRDTLNKMYHATKLFGFFGFNCKLCFKMTVNATPFQTGLYMMYYIPWSVDYVFHGANQKVESGYAFRSNPRTISYHSGFNAVYLNVGSVSAAELKVPFTGPTEFVDVHATDLGTLRVQCLTKLRGSTNDEKAHVTLYFWLEDLKTHAIGTNQIGQYTASTELTRVWSQSTEINEQSTDSDLLSQIKGLFTGQSSAQESQQQTSAPSGGAVSNIANTVSSVASSLTAIPGVADIAGPVSWVAKGIGSVASMFGFSKPLDRETEKVVRADPFYTQPYADGKASFLKLAMSKDCEIQSRPIGLTTEDEMSIQHIITRPVAFHAFPWDTSMPRGQLIRKLWVHPKWFATIWRQTTGEGNSIADVNLYSHTYLSYLSMLFMFWRGSIKFTLQFVANKFYSGRLRLIYIPGLPVNSATTVSQEFFFNNSQLYYTLVVDIRDANTITVDLPFISSSEWRACDLTATSALSHQPTLGALYIFVEDPLVTTSTVAPTLDIWTSVSGGEDFQYAVPRFNPDTYQYHNQFMRDPVVSTQEVEPQGFTDGTTNDDTVVEFPMASKASPEAALMAMSTCIGDPVTSLRYLGKREWFIDNFQIGPHGDGPYRLIFLKPHTSFLFGDGIVTPGFVHHGMLSNIETLYRYKCGGMRFTLAGLTPGQYEIKWFDPRIQQGYTPYNYTDWGRVGFSTGMSYSQWRQLNYVTHTVQDVTLSGKLAIELPYHNYWPVTLNNKLSAGPNTSIGVTSALWNPASQCGPLICAILLDTASSENNLMIWESFADDRNYGYLLGPPMTYGRYESAPPP